jgi:hypothetical protein
VVGIPFARYRVTGAIPNVQIQVHVLNKLFAQTSQTVRNTGTDLSVETTIRVQDFEKSGQSVRLQLPSQFLVKDDEIRCQGVNWTRTADDTNTLLLNPDRTPVASFIVQFSLTLPWPTEAIEVPVPRITGRVTVGNYYLLLPPELQTVDQPQSSRIALTELPAWVRGDMREESITAWVGEDRWSVRAAEPKSDGRTGVPLRIDRLTSGQSGTISGRTTIITDSRFPAENLEWPNSLQLRQLKINSRPIEIQANDSGQLFVHRERLSRAVVIEVYWTMKPTSFWQRFERRVDFPFPQLAGECCLLQFDGFAHINPSSAGVKLTTTTPAEYNLVYARQFQRIWGAIASDQQLRLQGQLFECYHALRSVQHQPDGDSPINSELDSTSEQLAAIIEQNSLIDTQSHSQPFSQQLFRISENRLHAGLVFQTVPPSSGPAIVIGCLLLSGWVVSRLVSRLSGPGRARIESSISIAAGLVWIAFLQPTTVGVVFVGLGLLAPRLAAHGRDFQLVSQTEPIAMAPTTKQ